MSTSTKNLTGSNLKHDFGNFFDNLHDKQQTSILTDNQKIIYFACMQHAKSVKYNMALHFKISKQHSDNVELLKNAINSALKNHPILFSHIEHRQDDVYLVQDKLTDVCAVRPCYDSEVEDNKQNFIRNFDFAISPLCRAELLETKHNIHCLFDFHHIVFDGTSFAIICKEISALLDNKAIAGETINPFNIHSINQKIKNSPVYERCQTYFTNFFSDIEVDSNLIYDLKPEENQNTFPSKLHKIKLSKADNHQKIQDFIKENHISESTFFMAAFGYALAKSTGQQESLFCALNHGRYHKNLLNCVSMLAQTLPVYINFSEANDIQKVLKDVQSNFYETIKHAHYPLQNILEQHCLNTDIIFSYQGELFNGIHHNGNFIPIDFIESNQAQCNLGIIIISTEDSYEIQIRYRSDLYEQSSIESFAKLYMLILEGFLTSNTLQSIALTDNSDLILLDKLNNTTKKYDASITIVDMFKEQAKKYADKTAVIYKNKHISYKELDQLSDNIAQYITDRGIKKGDIVSILLERSEFMAIAALGALKAAVAYQPLDPTYPMDRLQFMMQDANTRLLIADANLLHLVPTYNKEILNTADISNLPNIKPSLSAPKPTDLFALLYTSGSTGIPKGCMLNHANLRAFVAMHTDVTNMDENSVSAAFASFGFDANFMDMYPVLCLGGTLHIIAEDIRLNLEALAQYYADNSMTHSFMTTQVGRQFTAHLSKIPSMVWLGTGGEALPPINIEENISFCNIYGPTECTVYATSFTVDKLYDPVPIGTALNNIKLYVIDAQKRLLPVNAIGELCISGPQVSQGYLGRDEETNKVFTKNDFCNDPEHSRLYHTGDIVRMRVDGNIEFIGRRDMQVKIRGFRIELTEVEGIISEYPDITSAVVIAKDAPSGGKMLHAYIVAQSPIDIQKLHDFILSTKPPYMVPSATMQLDAIPLTPNQKVDKKKLPEISQTIDEEGGNYHRETTKLEDDLLKITQDILGQPLSINTNLRLAGLSSIAAIKLATILHKNYGYSPDVKNLLKDATILSLENDIVQHLIQSASSTQSEESQTLDKIPLSQTQLGIYLASLNDISAYAIPILIKLPQSIDKNKLKDAIHKTVAAHTSILCAIKADENGDPHMYPRPNFVYEIHEETWQSEQMPKATVFAFDDSALFNLRLLTKDQQIYLFLEFHHIIADGESVTLFISDINKAYTQATLVHEDFTMFDVAITEQKERKTTNYTEAKQYYDSIFNGVNVNSLPDSDVFDKESSPQKSHKIIPQIAPDISTYCQKHSLSENAFFTAAFAMLLAKFSAHDEVVFSVIYNGRNNPRAFATFGMLVKTLPLFCQIKSNMCISDFVKEVEESLQGLRQHDIFSFAEACSTYNLNDDILFGYQGDMLQNMTFCGEKIEHEEVPINATKSPINIDVFKNNQYINISLEYDNALYSDEFIQSFLNAYEACIISFLTNNVLSEISLLSQDDTHNLQSLHNTYWATIYRPAYRLLQDSAQKTPHATAVIADKVVLNYAELNAKANQMGRALLEKNVGVNEMVALILERSANVYVARQGILKSGAAFLSIDPTYPDERINFIMKDSAAKVLITTKDIYAKRQTFFDSLGIEFCFIEQIEHFEDHNLDIDVPAQALAYCIYTSGSTGTPKGVMLTQQNLINFIDENPKNHEILGYTQFGKVSLALAAITFDVSIMEEFIPLAHGMAICMATLDEIHNPLALCELCSKNHVDVMSCTPSFLLNLLDIEQAHDIIKRLKSIDFGAEAFPPALFTKLQELNPDLYIMNGYGPTEATISCTMGVVQGTQGISIGTPNANVKVVMIDDNNHALPIGAVGEMLIMGQGVGKGYCNRPQLTEEVFIRFWDYPAYKSGDFARLLPNGNIEYRGRRDNQVKLRGLRVELSEIEAAINDFKGIKSSFILVKDSPAGQYLAAYFTAENSIDTSKLIKHLETHLVQYMIPSVFKQLDSFPLTTHGKIDKTKLPETQYTIQQKTYAAPQNNIEKDFCDFFAQILNLSQVGIDDNFFELGGTSLSASKIAVMAMGKNYPVVYADIFKNPTPKQLAIICKQKHTEVATHTTHTNDINENSMSYNCMHNIDNIGKNELGNVLLTGVTGFLGIHILHSYLTKQSGTIYCFMRKGKSPTLEKRLASLLVYYFDSAMEDITAKRVVCIEGDITDLQAISQLKNVNFDTIINCAAIVKHFVHDDSLEKTNVQGVKNLIELCQENNKKLIHISTVSVAGEGIDNHPPIYKKLHENELFIGQSLENAYIKSKFDAEKAILAAIEDGLDGKIMRVGNLMSRTHDGEFQINSKTNGFMRQLKGYKILGKYPISLMAEAAEFSPIDACADAIIELSCTDKKFTIFHPYNNHIIYMADVIQAMNMHGFKIDIVSDQSFQEELMLALSDDTRSEGIAGLLTYLDNSSAKKHLIDSSNTFTTAALYRLGFLWPITDMHYLARIFALLDEFGFFD